MIMKTEIRPFHLAIPVNNLDVAKKFYIDILGSKVGRFTNTWVDLNFFGHQLVLHLTDIKQDTDFNFVDNKKIQIPHFGVILNWKDWINLSEKIKDKIDFIIEPYVRFKGQTGEQATMFFLDKDNNALEFKAFKNDSMIFEKY